MLSLYVYSARASLTMLLLCSVFSVDPDFIKYLPNDLCLIWHDGRVQWFSPGIMTSYCKISVRYFPFDIQVCEIIFVSWAYNDQQIVLIPNKQRLASEDR